jgi:hypothetical protein
MLVQRLKTTVLHKVEPQELKFHRSLQKKEGQDQEVAPKSVLVTMTIFLVLISINQKSSLARFESLLCGRCVPARMPENQYAPYNVAIGPDHIPKFPYTSRLSAFAAKTGKHAPTVNNPDLRS